MKKQSNLKQNILAIIELIVVIIMFSIVVKDFFTEREHLNQVRNEYEINYKIKS